MYSVAYGIVGESHELSYLGNVIIDGIPRSLELLLSLLPRPGLVWVCCGGVGEITLKTVIVMILSH